MTKVRIPKFVRAAWQEAILTPILLAREGIKIGYLGSGDWGPSILPLGFEYKPIQGAETTQYLVKLSFLPGSILKIERLVNITSVMK